MADKTYVWCLCGCGQPFRPAGAAPPAHGRDAVLPLTNHPVYAIMSEWRRKMTPTTAQQPETDGCVVYVCCPGAVLCTSAVSVCCPGGVVCTRLLW